MTVLELARLKAVVSSIANAGARSMMKAEWHGVSLPLTRALLLGLLFGGRVIPRLTNPNHVGEMRDFETADFDILIEEGRRQVDSQVEAFKHVQARSQLLFTAGLAVLAFVAGGLGRTYDVDGLLKILCFFLLVPAGVLVFSGVGVAAAVIVVRADFVQVDTTQLSTWNVPLKPRLATDYADAVRIGEITVASRVTAFRTATRQTIWGAYLTFVLYLLTLL